MPMVSRYPWVLVLLFLNYMLIKMEKKKKKRKEEKK